MAQAQCPNCGGYKVRVIQRGPSKWSFTDWLLILGGWFVVWLIGGIILIMILAAVFKWDASINSLIWYAGFPIGWFIAYLKAPKQAPDLNLMHCDLCGYEWDKRNVSSRQVQVRPDLIAKGEARLQELAEEKRRRDRMWD